MSAINAGDGELIPLEWVRKWIGKRMANVVKVIDSIPLDLRTHRQWKMARDEAKAAQSDVMELVRLAAWLNIPAGSAASVTAPVPPACRQRAASVPKKGRKKAGHTRGVVAMVPASGEISVPKTILPHGIR